MMGIDIPQDDFARTDIIREMENAINNLLEFFDSPSITSLVVDHVLGQQTPLYYALDKPNEISNILDAGEDYFTIVTSGQVKISYSKKMLLYQNFLNGVKCKLLVLPSISTEIPEKDRP